MKKIIEVVLVLVMFISVTSHVGAAEAENKTQGMKIKAKLQFNQSVDSSKVSNNMLVEVEQKAIVAIQQETNNNLKYLKKNKNIDDNQIFNYITSDENFTYLYESYSNGKQSNLLVNNKERVVANEINELSSVNSASPLAAVDLPDGWGGRQKISSSGNVLTTSILLPTTVTKSGNGVGYIYVGFSGSKESDMGLQYSLNRGPGGNQPAWVPFMRLTGNIWADQIAPNDQVVYKNGYMPGASVGIQAFKNYNSTGNVRLVTFGYAICSDRLCTNTGAYYLTTITDYAMTISSISYWKLVATFAVLSGQTEGTGTFQSNYSNVVIDYVAVPNANFQIPETDYATITRNGNNVTIIVNKTS